MKHFKENRIHNGFEGKLICDPIQNNFKVKLFEERSDEMLTSKTYDVEKHSKLTYIFFGYEAKVKKTKQK